MRNPVQVIIDNCSGGQAVVYINTMDCLWISNLSLLTEMEKKWGDKGVWSVGRYTRLAKQVDPTKYIERDELDMRILLGEFDD